MFIGPADNRSFELVRIVGVEPTRLAAQEPKGDIANCVIETDGKIETDLGERIRQLPNIRSGRAINI